MPVLTKLQIESRLEAARLLIDNAIADTEIQNSLTTVGFTLTQLQAGQTLLSTAVGAVAHQDEVAGQKASATVAQGEAAEALRVAYQGCVDRARLVGVAALLTGLGIVGSTPKALAGLILAAEKFLHTAGDSPSVAAALATRGVDAVRLAGLQSALTTLKTAESAQEKAKGDSQSATQAQNDALAALQAFVGPLKRGARIACKGREGLLTKLGL
jgi:hypothetical protein